MTASLALNPVAQDVRPDTGIIDHDDESIMTKGLNGVVRQLKDRLRRRCKQRRIRLQEFFKPYDTHHSKKVSKGQFRRALDQAGLTAPARGAPVSDLLTQREVEILSRRYEVKAEGNGSVTAQGIGVNYWKLCEQIEKVFARRGMEKNPMIDVKLSLEDRPESGYGVHRPGLSADDVTAVGKLLSRVRLLADTEGLIVRNLFDTFDKRNSGKVTASIFLRQLDSMFKGRLSKAEARLLLRAYQTRDGNVSWRAMHSDCATDISPSSSPDDQRMQKKRQQRLQLQQPGSDDGEQSQSVSTTGISPIHAVNGDGDDSSSVVSSVTGFPAREVVGFNVGTKERYSVESGDGVQPGTGGIFGGGPRWAAMGRGAWRKGVNLGVGETLPIERQMASKVVYHRLEPEDDFLIYDPSRSGVVSVEVFRRGLADAFRMPFTAAELSALVERYRSGADKVSYRRLCDHACDLAERAAFGNKLQRVPAATAAAECGGGGSNIPSGGAHDGGGIKSTARNNDEDQLEKLLEETLETMKATLRRRRLSIQPGFRDFDRKGEGHVSVGQMQRVLCSYGVLPLDGNAQALLERRYAAVDDPRHPAGFFISYRQLLEDLGEGPRGTEGGRLDVGREGGDPRFTGGGNDAGGGSDSDIVAGGPGSSSVGSSCVAASQSRVFGKPTGLARPAHSVVTDVSMTSSVVLGMRRDRSAHELLSHLKAFVLRSRLRTLEFFRCDDPMRSGSMSREKFGRSLLSTGFRVSPVELETLCEAYPLNSLSDDGGKPFVRYQVLLEEVEGVFGVKDLERQPQCDVESSIQKAQASITDAPGSGTSLPEMTPLADDEDAIVMETLREIGAQAHRRRLSLAPELQCFDRFKRGVVLGTMFERALSGVGLLPSRRKTRLLCRKFAERFTSPDARSDVNYRAFLVAIDLALEGYKKIPEGLLTRANAPVISATNSHNRPAAPVSSPQNNTLSTRSSSTNGDGRSTSTAATDGKNSLSVDDVVQEVVRQLAVGWVDIKDFLSDADRFKQGKVSFPKLKVALALAGVELTDAEFRTLKGGFKSDKSADMVDWRRLAIAVNRAGGAPVSTSWNGKIVRDPAQTSRATDKKAQETGAVNGNDAAAQQQRQSGDGDNSVVPQCGRVGLWAGGVGEDRRGFGTFDDTVQHALVEKALDAVRHRVKHYRVHLMPSFQDFDPNRRKRITRRQFLSVLGNIDPSLTEKQQAAICDRYTVRERSPGERVLYTKFCDDVDPESVEPRNSPTGL